MPSARPKSTAPWGQLPPFPQFARRLSPNSAHRRAGDYVVEGRDIGTVVFPEAPVKVFLTASAEERATRRVKQNEERRVGSTNYEEVLADIKKRDEIDSSRAASPLKPAEDAVHLDSTGKTIEEIISFICSRAEQAQG